MGVQHSQSVAERIERMEIEKAKEEKRQQYWTSVYFIQIYFTECKKATIKIIDHEDKILYYILNENTEAEEEEFKKFMAEHCLKYQLLQYNFLKEAIRQTSSMFDYSNERASCLHTVFITEENAAKLLERYRQKKRECDSPVSSPKRLKVE